MGQSNNFPFERCLYYSFGTSQDLPKKLANGVANGDPAASTPEQADDDQEHEHNGSEVEPSGAEHHEHSLPESIGRHVEDEARQRELKRSLETKSRCTHAVHCPFFPLVIFLQSNWQHVYL